MPNKVEPKVIDPEAELSSAQKTFERLAPQCSVQKRAQGIPQLAPQEKQMAILNNEMDETLLCIQLASKGQHAVRDTKVKRKMHESIVHYEMLEAELRDERAQQAELDCLNYLAQKNVIDLLKKVPSESDELTMLENAYNRLRRMENRLDLATKRFCIVNTDNKRIREEIHRLIVERNSFNIQWKRTISTLVKGKQYLMDILEIASRVFSDRDEWCRKLDTLKWKGLYQLNKDIAEMQIFDGELNHLAKLEEFLRVKGSRRICEADEIEEAKRLEEVARCEQEIARHDALLEEIFQYVGTEKVLTIIKNFQKGEIENFSILVLLCEVMQQSIFLRKGLEEMRQRILDQRDIQDARTEKEDKRLAELTEQLTSQHKRTERKLELNKNAEYTLSVVLKAIDEIFRLAQCDLTPLMSLLGNHREVTMWNVRKFLVILEIEIKSLIQMVYSAVKPPAPMPTKAKGAEQAKVTERKLVANPVVKLLVPNRIETLVPYQPCAYCVEDYIMNLVFETPAVPADKEYIEGIFHLEDDNTKFGIYTLTVPEKRHAYRSCTKDT